MQPLIGHATKFQRTQTASLQELLDFNHAWEVLFAYAGPEMALREVGLGPLPGKFPSMAIRQVVMDKHAAGNARAEQRSRPADACVLCKLPFGSRYDDPNFGPIVITRNRRNKFYCNTCDLFLRICPGQVTLELPIMVVDVKHSRRIRNHPDVDLYRYSRLLSDFQCTTAAVIQKHLGLVLNTVGDAVIGVWPSGFVPVELREKYGWDDDQPARVSARLALRAARELADLSPTDFTGSALPFKGALDSTEMVIFSVRSCDKVAQLDYADLDDALAGPPLIDDDGNLLFDAPPRQEEYQNGPTSIDVAGEAIELASELSGYHQLAAGDFAVTRRLDRVADQLSTGYREVAEFNVPFRVIGR
ncbi:hypothetical protein [Lewinella sp. JB7]|uniref:hypothetical protein n=1 Tax=Lewinella sp. JB7 TaxID=2962887 RepID=UPI0020C9C1C7|nr:hypothetical protein [Lewinella sp. JB7]MCP9234671.1 hypothetical protein [Lewinella sp. JB7]